MATEQEAETINPSLSPDHFLLVSLDRTNGQPLTVEELVERFSARLAESAKAGHFLSKYIDPKKVIQDSLNYAEKIKLIEHVPEARPESVIITTLGSLIALGLQPQPDNQVV